MSEAFNAEWFAERLGDRTRRGIARETGALIRSGALPVGAKLPPVRELAFVLGISPATVSQAWTELRRHKIIGGRGRNGAWVLADRFAARPERHLSGGNYGPGVLNLAIAGPDLALLPPLDVALAQGARAEKLNSYERVRILPQLDAAVRPSWPYDPGAFLATNGGYNAVYTLLHALVPPGAPVAIEDPTALRLLDILEDLDVPILPVDCDGEGPLPTSLARALQQRPAAFLFQPRIHSVTGALMSAARLEAIGDLLDGTNVLIIEDDGVGDISGAPRISLGRRFPDRVIHILSYSKTHGPDLRLAVLSSSATIVEQIQSYRSFSAGWTSRILQAAAVWLLQDAATIDHAERARDIYRRRRVRLADELAKRDVVIDAGHGLSVLIPVASESYALVTLAAHGIAVHAGAKFSTQRTSAIRVATSILREEHVERVADSIALATGPA
ncbi:aminotransferase class I/II-fold pyridoxal phosphate-dependent enzyme [Mesorhizobium sp. ES1-4]|uniref:aminotransferase class I/II-fold pyridoxal phosphate-dependent enzyme n=1 Tax=Mesorhizobium sp. ES1-4 TaxID=2876627 RepID=UPI001CCF7162|nr:PLP-dependent aminotransferase family protein [Mesorhizobium sp. ES1-4]MBZ9798382.1 PLP-dependent aminotransferase family protein [Mesorhizobium sp. ES1-4]